MKVTKPKHDKNKSDAFSLGLVLLEAGLLKSIQNVYDRKTGKIKQNELHSMIEEFSNRYVGDYDLVQALRSLLVVSEFDRSGFAELKMQYATNMNLRELAKSDHFQSFNFIDIKSSDVSTSRNHNPMNTVALGTNKAYNPISNNQVKQRYGTDYMNFDDADEGLNYWNGNPPQHPSNKKGGFGDVSNPLTGGLLNKGKRNHVRYEGQRKPLNGVSMNNNKVNYFAKRAQANDVRNPLSDYQGFSHRRKHANKGVIGKRENVGVGQFRY